MMIESDIRQHLLELEESLLQTENRKSPEYLSSLLADEFIEFGSSGRSWTKSQIIEVLQQETNFYSTLTNFQVKKLAPLVYLATYQIEIQEVDHMLIQTSLRSSIWIDINGYWQMFFHQGTPIKP